MQGAKRGANTGRRQATQADAQRRTLQLAASSGYALRRPATVKLRLKRGAGGSNPPAPTKFLQLGGLFETLIGGPVTTAGNHRCMLPDGEGCPAAVAASPSTTRARRAPTAGTTGTEAARKAEGPAASGLADAWQDTGRIFTTATGAPLGARHIRKMFQDVCERAGFGRDWAPRNLRHTFVSLLSDDGMAIEKIGRLAGHASSHVNESVYRQELRPVLQEGAEALDGGGDRLRCRTQRTRGAASRLAVCLSYPTSSPAGGQARSPEIERPSVNR